MCKGSLDLEDSDSLAKIIDMLLRAFDIFRSFKDCVTLFFAHSLRANGTLSQPVFVVLICLLLSACGDSSDSDNRLGRIDVIPGTAEIGLGENLQLEVLGVLNDGQTQYISPTAVDWLSNDISIATVDAAGLVTATGEGVATVTATTSGITGSMRLTVLPGLRLQILPPLVIDPVSTQKQLRALGFQSDFETIDLTQEVTWASTDDSIATVDASGLLTIVAEGSVRLSATLRSLSNDIPVIGNNTQLDSIEITPAIKIVPVGVEVNYSASGVFNDGSVTDLTNLVAWGSSDEFVALVDEKGLATGLAIGSAQIRADFLGFQGTARLLVTSSNLIAVSVLPNNVELPSGIQKQLQMLAFYADGITANVTNEATWTTSNESAATVSSAGLVLAEAPGSAVIGAVFSGFSASSDVTVTSAVLSALRISPVNKTTPAGVDVQYEATGVYSDGSTDNLTNLVDWQSGDVDVAVIDIDGLARTVSAGGTTISASFSPRVGEASSLIATTNLSVTRAALIRIQHVPALIDGPAGTSEQLIVRAIYSDDSTVDVTRESTFVSANGDIAAVQSFGDNAGLVSLLLPGTTTITTSFGGAKDIVDVTVSSAELVSVQLSPVAQQLPAGLSVQYTAFGLFTDGTSENISEEIFWQSGDPDIIAIDENGLALGLTVGNALVSGAYQGDAQTAILDGSLKTLLEPLPRGLRLVRDDVRALDSKVGFSALRITEAEVDAVQITPANVTGPAGVSTALALTAIYTDGTALDATQNAIWITADPNIAAVGVKGNSAGLLELLASGETTVAATFAGAVDSTQVVVSEAVLVSFNVYPGSKSLPKGIQQQFQAIGVYSDGSSAILTNVASWQTTDSAIASVTAKGLLTANGSGEASVIANIEGYTAFADLTVTAAELALLQIVPLEVTGPIGNGQQLTLIAYYSDGTTSDATQQATWTSDSPNVALVDNNLGRQGQLYLLSEGVASISASWDGQQVLRTRLDSNSIDVTVTAAVLAEIIVSPRNESIPVGVEIDYTATGIYSDLSHQDITDKVSWVSSEASIATVTAEGRATAVTEGSAAVSARLLDVVSSAILTVTPASIVSIAIEPAFLDGPSGRLARLTATALLSDNSTEDITKLATWQSLDTAIAGVVTSGLLGGLVERRTPGETQISASFNSASDVVAVQVSDAVLEAINIQPVNGSVAAGLGVQYEASGAYSDGQIIDLSREVFWQSSDLNVAAIGQGGKAFTSEAGTAMISATLSGITSSVPLIVTDAVLTDLQLTPASIVAPSGTQSQLTLVGYYSDGSSKDLTAQATYTSSDVNVAVIQTGTSNAGSVNLLSVGSVTATASFGGLQETSNITVTAAVLERIEVTPSNQSRPVGINTQYQAFGIYSDGGSKDITDEVSWSSSNTAVASISQAGVAIGLSTGSVVITANDDASSIVGTTNLTVTNAVLTELVIEPRSLNEPVGTSTQLTARAYFSNGQDEDATTDASWVSSDVSVVDVVGTGANAGRVTMTGVGSAVVSASWNGIRTIVTLASNVTDSVPVTVTGAELVSIKLTPLDTSLPVGISQAYSATGFYTDSSNRDITDEVTWQTSDQSVAVILRSGLLISVGQGVTSVTATFAGVSQATTLIVTPAVVTSVSITPGLVEAPAGSVVVLTLTAFYSDNSNQNVSADATWSSSNTNSVLVVPSGENGGQAVLEAEGTATITAAYRDFNANASVAVTAAVITSVQINPATATVAKGLSVQYELIASYSDNSSAPVTDNISWRSSDTGIATVSDQGVALGLGQGVATVSAQFGGLSDDSSLMVTDPILADLQIQPATISEPAGATTQLVATAIYTDFSTQDVTDVGIWSSDDEAVARVGVTGALGGQLDFIAVGQTLVNMSFGNQTASTSVATTDAVLTSITITPPMESVPAGMEVEYKAQGLYSNNTSRDITDQVTWQTSNSAIVTIDQQGIAQGISLGVAAVSAKLGSIQSSVALVVTDAVVTSIQVTPPNFAAPAGTSKQFSAQAFFSDGTSSNATREATWISDDESIAVVIVGGQSAGITELLAQGSAQITASLAGLTDTVDVTVTAAVLQTISLSPVNKEIPLGIEIQYQANGTYSDGSSSVLTDVADWSSNVPETITITESGLARGVGVGSVVVRASFDGVVGTTNVTVTAAVLSSLEITPAFLIEPKGSAIQLNARAIYTDGTVQDATEEATWSSSDPAAVVVGASGVNGGLASMIDTGSASITASWNGLVSTASTQSDTIGVVVTDAVLSSIQINPAEKSLPAGVEEQFTATGIYSDSSTTDITDSVAWQTGSTSIATIDGNGLLSGVSVGQTTVTAMLDGVTELTNVTVTDALLTGLQITPASLSEPAGTSARLTLTAFYSDDSNKDVTTQASWLSSNPVVAAVVTSGADAGSVNLLAVGTANITASFEGSNDATPVNVTVTAAELESIRVAPFGKSLPVGIEHAYTATGIFGDDSSRTITDDVSWTISDNNIASITSAGVVEALAQGVVVVTATSGAIKGRAVLVVTAATLIKLQISPPGLQAPLGTTEQLTVLAYFSDDTTEDATQEASWISADTSIISVGTTGDLAGFVTTVSQGETTISASWDGATGRAEDLVSTSVVAIVNDVELVTIEVTPKSPTSALGTSRQFTAMGIFTDNSSSDITADVFWRSANRSVATIDANGVADTLTAGTATIAAFLNLKVGATEFTVSEADIVALQITPAGLSEPAGTSKQLTATAIYTDGTQEDVTKLATWVSSDADFVEIGVGSDNGGLAQLIAQGAADITASFDGLADVTPITVTAAIIDSIVIDPAVATTNVGLRVEFNATGIYSDGTSSPLNQNIEWQSDNLDVAVIDSQGEAFAVDVGSATILATFNGLQANAILNVDPATIEDVYIAPSFVVDAKGTVRQLEAFARYSSGAVENVTHQMTWTTSRPEIATVDTSNEFAGQLTLVSEGITTVGIGWNNILAVFASSSALSNIPVFVTQATLERLEVSPLNQSMPAGLEQQYAATGIYSDNTSSDLTNQVSWTTSNNDVATMTASGFATAIAIGDATIAATFEGATTSTNLNVSASVLQAGQITPSGLREPAGTSRQFTFIGTYLDGTEQDLTRVATWTSTVPQVVSVVTTGENAGMANLLSVGTADIKASVDGVEDVSTVIVTDAVLLRIDLDPPTLTTARGAQTTYTATGVYSDGSSTTINDDVDWTSSDSDVIIVTPTGQAQALTSGTATITATLDGDIVTQGSSNVTVTEDSILFLEINPSLDNLTIEQGTQYSAYARYSDFTSVDVTDQTTWSTSDPAVASISNGADSGFLSALTAGEVTITGTFTTFASFLGGDTSLPSFTTFTGIAGLDITAPTIITVDIIPSNTDLVAGTTAQWEAIANFDGGDSTYITTDGVWSTSDTSVATVSDGVVTAVGTGTANIAIIFREESDSVLVTVSAPDVVEIVVSPSAITVPQGVSQQFTAIAQYDNGTNLDVTKDVTWSSTSTSVATISNALETAGLASTVGVGLTSITAVLGADVANLAELTVEASTATGLVIEPAIITVGEKSIMQYQALLQFGAGPIQNVTDDAAWGTNDKKVAKVDSSKNRGKVTAEKQGSTQITADYEDSNGLFTAASNITVTAECTETGGNDIESLVITTDPSDPSANMPVTTVGGVVQLHAIVTYVDGCSSIFFEKNGLNWKSLDKDVVDVSKKGEVTGLEIGAGDVEAKIKGETTIITITVTEP